MKSAANKIICRDLAGKKYPVDSRRLSFRPSVYGVIIRDRKVLLFKQWDGYDLPGGGVDLGETLEAAAKREIWEETGYRVAIGNLIAAETSFYRFQNIDPHGKRFAHCFMLYYTARITGGRPSKKNFDRHEKKFADLPEWIGLTDLDKIKIYNSLGQKRITEIIRLAAKKR